MPPGPDEEIQAKAQELEPALMDLATRLRETGLKVFPRRAYGKKIGDTILEAVT